MLELAGWPPERRAAQPAQLLAPHPARHPALLGAVAAEGARLRQGHWGRHLTVGLGQLGWPRALADAAAAVRTAVAAVPKGRNGAAGRRHPAPQRPQWAVRC